MADLTSSEKLKLEKFLGMGGGYVLNFTNRTFKEFILENVGLDIDGSKYQYLGSSKANRLRSVWKIENNSTVGLLLDKLLDHWKLNKELNDEIITQKESVLLDDCMFIVRALFTNSQCLENKSTVEPDNHARKLNELLIIFDEQAKSSDHQKRGYILEKLLNDLLRIEKFEVKLPFKRNGGGEQIDGAFIFNNWYYLLECKWTKDLSDINELDSLLAKVNRSGKQTMGLFLSINGWSTNIIALLKQNPNKSIFLVDGYDLRCILNTNLTLTDVLSAKIAKFNFESEPFLSAVEILKSKPEN